jgi:hypothetical protein
MKRIAVLLVVVLASSAFGKLRKWNEKMQELGKTFSAVLPEVVSSEPLTPEGKKRLEKSTRQLSELAHTIKPGKDAVLPPEADPTLRFVSGLFERDAKAAHRAAQAGDFAYAKTVVRRMAGYCIACHTRHDRGPDFPTMELTPKMETLTPMERGELFAALRQFDQALLEYEKVAADGPTAEKRPWDWARAVRHGLYIAVRVKDDPEKASTLVNKALSLPQVPRFFRTDALAWKENIEQWKKDRGNSPKTEEGYFLEAVRLTQAARAKQEFPMDHAQDVSYLRATALVHRQLSEFPDGKRASEALLLAGGAYSVFASALLSPLPELYYEACIRRAPHTAIAQTCFRRYEQEVYVGYSGSGGTFIPDDIKALMATLRDLSDEPKKP